ncbi:MAG: hypothetical protein COA79_17515 [Planctomycetota bacterium]|nr:MAG: hypothetical protein COA79_17515 [Planctomycetota bacterium]
MSDEIERRKISALEAIKKSYGTEEGEYNSTLFVSHHLEELDAEYWQKNFGTMSPDPIKVLDYLQLKSHWSEEDDVGIDIFDFTLPGDVTDSVLSVNFDEDGNITSVDMES